MTMTDSDPARQANYQRGIDTLNTYHPLSEFPVSMAELVVVIGRLTEALREVLIDYGRLKEAALVVCDLAASTPDYIEYRGLPIDVSVAIEDLRSVMHKESGGV